MAGSQDVEYRMSLKDLLTPALQNADEKAKGLEETLKGVGEIIGITFAAREVYEFGKELLHTTAQFEGFTNVIKYASLNMADGQQNIDYLGSAIKRLHLPMQETYKAFSELQAGLYGTGIEGDKLRNIFEGMGTASSVLHLSAEKFGDAGYALKEIGEIGTLQMRQMRMLAISLPGAMNIAAQSMGLSTQKFHEKMHAGLITAAEFLPKFGEALKEHFEGGLARSAASLQSAMNDTDTKIYEGKVALGEKLKPVYIAILQDVAKVADYVFPAMMWMVDKLESHATALKLVGGAIAGIVAGMLLWNIRLALNTGLMWLNQVSIVAAELNVNMLTAAYYMMGVTSAGAFAAATGGLGLIAVGIYEMYNAMEDMNAKFDEFGDENFWDPQIEKISKIALLWKDIEDHALGYFYALKLAMDITSPALAATDLLKVKMYDDEDTKIWNGTYGLTRDAAILKRQQEGEFASVLYGPTMDGSVLMDPNKPIAPFTMLNKPGTFNGAPGTANSSGADGKTIPPASHASGTKSVTVNVHINDLIKDFKIYVASKEQGLHNMHDEVAKVLSSALNNSVLDLPIQQI